jgi:hypothetical protein
MIANESNVKVHKSFIADNQYLDEYFGGFRFLYFLIDFQVLNY